MTLSDRVRQLLKERDWSQVQLAQASGLDPSVLSRLLAGERPWRQEHIACLAAALSMTPEGLTKDTDTPADRGGELDAEFVTTLTRAHATLVSDNAKLNAELETAQSKIKQMSDEQQRLNRQIADLQLSLDRETRTRLAVEAEKHATEKREGELARQVSTLKAERSTLTIELDATRLQLSKCAGGPCQGYRDRQPELRRGEGS